MTANTGTSSPSPSGKKSSTSSLPDAVVPSERSISTRFPASCQFGHASPHFSSPCCPPKVGNGDTPPNPAVVWDLRKSRAGPTPMRYLASSAYAFSTTPSLLFPTKGAWPLFPFSLCFSLMKCRSFPAAIGLRTLSFVRLSPLGPRRSLKSRLWGAQPKPSLCCALARCLFICPCSWWWHQRHILPWIFAL